MVGNNLKVVISQRLDCEWLWLGWSGGRGACAAHTASSCAEPDSERSEPRRRDSAAPPLVDPGFFFTCPPKLKNLHKT